jgi:hypothetical protein
MRAIILPGKLHLLDGFIGQPEGIGTRHPVDSNQLVKHRDSAH